VAGKHVLPTSRSDYLSVTTWTLKRIVILAVAVIVGALVLKNGFPSNASQSISGPPAAQGPSSSPSTSATTPRPSSRAPKPKNVRIQVLNASGRIGLATLTSQTLQNAGYKIKTPADAARAATTTIYYRADSKAAADAIQRKYFPNAPVKPAPASFQADVRVTIVLGSDFAGLPSASPTT
jgi:hypothetical protein